MIVSWGLNIVGNNFIYNNHTSFAIFHEHISHFKTFHELTKFVNYLKTRPKYNENLRKFLKVYKWIIIYFNIFISNRVQDNKCTIPQSIVTMYINSFYNFKSIIPNMIYINLVKKYLNKLIKYINRFILSSNKPLFLTELQQIIKILFLFQQKNICSINPAIRKLFLSILNNRYKFTKPKSNLPIYKDITPIRILMFIIKELSFCIPIDNNMHKEIDAFNANTGINMINRSDIFRIYVNGLICLCPLEKEGNYDFIMDNIKKFHFLKTMGKHRNITSNFMKKYIIIVDKKSNIPIYSNNVQYKNFKMLYPDRVFRFPKSIIFTNLLFTANLEYLKKYFKQ